MRKLNLIPYETEVDGKIMPYQVANSIVESLFNPARELGPVETLKTDKLAQKILDAESAGELLIEEAEYQDIRSAVMKLKGLPRVHVPFIRRILEETPEIEVKEA